MESIKEMNRTRFRHFLKKNGLLLILLIFSVALRLFIFPRIRPNFHTDTVTYLILSDLETVRTPGYPFFIECVQFFNDLFSITSDYLRLLAFVQVFVLGLLNCFLLYELTRKWLKSNLLALAAGLVYNLDYQVLSFEFILLTETLSVTLLLAVLFFYTRIFEGKRGAAIWAGIFSAFLLLTRPTFILLFIGFILITTIIHFRSFFKGDFIQRFGKALVVFILINIFAIGGWSLRNKIQHDYFGFSILFPYNLRYYTNRFFHLYEKGENKLLNQMAEIYLEENLHPGRFSKRAMQELHLTELEVSKLYLKMQLKVIIDNPNEYLKQIPEAINNYYGIYSFWWSIPNHQPLLFSDEPPSRFMRFFYNIFKALFTNRIPALILLAVLPLLLLILTAKKRRELHTAFLLVAVTNYNFVVSVLSANAPMERYRVPVEPLIFMAGLASLYLIFKKIVHITTKKGQPSSSPKAQSPKTSSV
ncbi:MAG: glycosyltransferase family 39 protein [Candidatus Aminicenantes bacterium]|nr:glycosyltransferase family 39 protein [Candidatus Aminicenantes bacterium]